MKLAVIGLGLRAISLIDTFMKTDEQFKVSAICDIKDEALIKKTIQEKNIRVTDDFRYYKAHKNLLENINFDAIMIASQCNTHTDIAIDAFNARVPVYLEKPVSTTIDDLKRLNNARIKYNPNVLVSFPLRVTPLASLAKELIENGEIGTVENVQAYNNVPYGRVYFKDWYRDTNITSGLWLQKATHDFDYITHILGYNPVKICAMSSKQIFKGDKPASLKCPDCDEYKTCPESTYTIKNIYKEHPFNDFCSFAEDTGNQDSGSAIIRYDTGMHVVYSQNFFARKSAGLRGARFLGYKGTLEFDWYTNKLIIHRHFVSRTDTYEYNSADNHFGGDEVLVNNFIDMVYNNGQSKAPLSEGILSALMCLAARKSCSDDKFVEIPYLNNLNL